MTNQRAANFLNTFMLVGAAFVTFFMYTSSLDPFNLPKSIIIFGLGMAALFSTPLVWKGSIRSKRLPLILLTLLIVLFTISGLVSTESTRRLFFGAFSRSTGLISYLGLTLLSMALVISTTKRNFKSLLAVLATVGVVETIYGFLQYFDLDPITWSNPYNPIIGTLGNPNFMSATLGFSGVAMLSQIFNSQFSKVLRIAAGLLGLLEFSLALLTDSVQGPIAFGGGLIFSIGIFLWHRKPKSTLFYGFTGISGIVFGVVLAGVAKIGPLADVLYQYTLGVRTQYWRAAIKMMESSPWFGVGVDSYGEHYRLVRDATTFKTVGPVTFTNAAHSVPLQLGATGGIPLLICYIVLQVLVAVRLMKMIKTDQVNRMAIASIGAAWLAFQAQSIISIDQLGVGVWGWVLTGSILGASYYVENSDQSKNSRKSSPKQNSSVSVALLASFGLIVGIGTAWSAGYVPDLKLRNAFATPWNKDDQASISYRTNAILEANKLNQSDAYYEALSVSELAKMPGAADAAISLSKEVADRHLDTWDAQNMAADIQENIGKPEDAVKYRERQLLLDPANWQPMSKLASDYQKIGKNDLAKALYQKVLLLAPKQDADYVNAEKTLLTLK